MAKRRKRRNPSGGDLVGFLVGVALPIGVDRLLSGLTLYAAGEVVAFGLLSAVVSGGGPGFARGAAVGGAAVLGTQLVRDAVARSRASSAVAPVPQ